MRITDQTTLIELQEILAKLGPQTLKWTVEDGYHKGQLERGAHRVSCHFNSMASVFSHLGRWIDILLTEPREDFSHLQEGGPDDALHDFVKARLHDLDVQVRGCKRVTVQVAGSELYWVVVHRLHSLGLVSHAVFYEKEMPNYVYLYGRNYRALT